MKKALVALSLLVFCLNAYSKRAAPPETQPIVKNGIRYSVGIGGYKCSGGKKDICGMMGFISASNEVTKKTLWKTAAYVKVYQANLETDVQDIFPHSLVWTNKNELNFKDEKGMDYTVNPKNGDLINPLKTVIYNDKKGR